MLSGFQMVRDNIFRNNTDEARKSTHFLARAMLSLLLFYTAIYPIMQVKSVLERRLLAQDLSSYLTSVNFLAILLYILLTILVFLVIRTMKLQSDSIGEKNIFNHLKQITLFLLTFFIASYLTWQIIFSIHRYLSPLEFLSPLIIVILLVYLVENITLRYWFIFASFILIMFSIEGPLPKIVSWNKSFFRVSVPDIEQLDCSIVFMAGKDPIAYLIPFFPPGARFIRLESYYKFNNPGVETKFHEEINDLIKNHDGPFYLLSRLMHFPHHKLLLKNLGLNVDQAESESIKSAHEPVGLRLWIVRKETQLNS